MNPKLFGSIVLVGIAVGVAACRTQLLDGQTGPGAADLHAAIDQATLDQAAGDLGKVDLGAPDLHPCCVFQSDQDLSGCIPIMCVLV